ncbi:MAG TPA: hypothetical protein VHX59_14785 [Mycobacteriales bacterium]|jgi:hypothetical protein|nr:hypothetical protein [Mycobacteriales bacterium]
MTTPALGLAPTELRPAIGDKLADQGIRTSIYAVQFLLDALYETDHAKRRCGS